MERVALVALGGSLGAVARYLLSGYAQRLSQNATFPIGTLVVNVLGCLVAGFLSQLAEEHGLLSAEMRVFLFIGVLGGFTTFSAFANESVNLMRQAEAMMTVVNVVANVLLCLGAVWAGRAIAFALWR